MYYIYGRKGCARCEVVKRRLRKVDETFSYEDLDSMPKEKSKGLIEYAKKCGKGQLPIILENGVIIEIGDILGGK